MALAFALLIGAGFIPGAEPPGSDHVELILTPYVALVVPPATLRLTAARIGPKGITLGRLLFFRRPEFFPWCEIVSVGLSDGARGPGRFRIPSSQCVTTFGLPRDGGGPRPARCASSTPI
ncbi:hypothetical protein ACFRAO_04135 [Streptomyces sp. NPDC056656]|uniref:hypothetical protein n=1 Tax=Streptomyces sp. NPDC056656 TaxID=3345895 RepID=UPI003679F563